MAKTSQTKTQYAARTGHTQMGSTMNMFTPEQGWVHMTCDNHPNLRWTRKDPSIPRISTNPQLMFCGDVTAQHLIPWTHGPLGDNALPSFMAKFEQEYVMECDCDGSHLKYVVEEEAVATEAAHTGQCTREDLCAGCVTHALTALLTRPGTWTRVPATGGQR